MMIKKKSFLSLTILFVLLGLLAGCASKSIKTEESVVPGADPSKLIFPPAPELKIPTPERFTLPNGLTVLLLEDRHLPLVSLSAIVNVSSYYDPSDKLGLAEITGTVMRTGGTKALSGDVIDEKLESLAAIVETYIGESDGGVYLNCLSENFDTSLEILVDILKDPVFDPDKITLAKTELKSAISRRNDDVGQIAGREFSRLLWGKDSAKGRIIEYDTINAIKRKDLVKFHKKYFVPNNMILGVVGDFDKTEMKSKLEKAFAGWEKTPVNFPVVKHREMSEPGINYIFKEDIKQSNIYMGYIAPQMQLNNPDYPAVSLMNYIMGQSFSSRLFREVRTTLGLAYTVRGYFSFDFKEPGTFTAFCQTKFASTTQAIDAIKKVINSMREGKVAKDEFARAKNALLNSFVFRFAKKRQILNQQLNLAFNGYPADFYTNYRKELEKVTIDDIYRVANKYIHPERYTLLVVGKKDEFDASLDKYGKVAELDITIPEPKLAPLPSATPEAIKAGKEILVKVVNANGGLKRLKKNTRRKVEFKLAIATPQGEFAMDGVSYYEYPYKQRQEISTPMGSMIIGFDGKVAWRKMGDRVQDLSQTEIERLKTDAKQQFRWIAINADKLIIYTAGKADVEGKAATKVIVKDGDEYISTLFVDNKTGLIVKTESPGKDQFTGAPVNQEKYNYDFKKINGIPVAMRTVIKQEGKKVMEINTKKIKMNPKIKQSIFKKEKK